jgi:hypothetical protein
MINLSLELVDHLLADDVPVHSYKPVGDFSSVAAALLRNHEARG